MKIVCMGLCFRSKPTHPPNPTGVLPIEPLMSLFVKYGAGRVVGQVPSPYLQCGRGRLCTSVDHCRYQERISPHDALGPVSIVAGRHASITMSNLYRLESLHEWFPTFAKIIRPMFEYRDGAVWLDDSRPGLGIELNHESATEYRVDPASDDARRDRLGAAWSGILVRAGRGHGDG